jgi:hypothetical protein
MNVATLPHRHLPALESGERMDRREFLARWEADPQMKRAELIEGVVYVASPVSKPSWQI